MAKKCTKKRNTHAKLFFCQSKPIAVVVIQKYCSHGNMTSHFSSRPMKIPGEFDPLSSHRPHLEIMAGPALGKQPVDTSWFTESCVFQASKDETEAGEGRESRDTLEGTPASRFSLLALKKAKK